ncbi:MAG: HAMP domain-containing protein [Pseudomonadota bacterium]
MGLRFKFNLILVAIFAAGFTTVGIIADRYLQQQAIDDAKRAANMVLDVSALANIESRMATALGSRLVEMRVREFDEKELQSGIDGEVAQRLLGARAGVRHELTDIFRNSVGQQKLVVARLIRVADTPARIRIVNIDYNAVTATAKLALTTLLSSLGVVFFAVFFVLNLMLDRMIVRPVAEMARQADAVSIGDFSIPEFIPQSKDEISVLGIAFNRLRRSTEEAIKLLKV